jgi:hypothetical protein
VGGSGSVGAPFIHSLYTRWCEQTFSRPNRSTPGKAVRRQLNGRLRGTHSRSVPFGEETFLCPCRKLNWDSAYFLLRILQVELRCGGCQFLLHRCYTCLPSRKDNPLVCRHVFCYVHAKFKSRQPVVWWSTATLPCVFRMAFRTLNVVRVNWRLALPVDIFDPGSSVCPTLFTRTLSPGTTPLPSQVQHVCTSYSCRFRSSSTLFKILAEH